MLRERSIRRRSATKIYLNWYGGDKQGQGEKNITVAVKMPHSKPKGKAAGKPPDILTGGGRGGRGTGLSYLKGLNDCKMRIGTDINIPNPLKLKEKKKKKKSSKNPLHS